MTDYTKSTNFASKDALASGNSLKIVKGTEIDTEFNSIATAVASKSDLSSPTFTGTPTLPTGTIAVTQSSSNSSTAIATTAFVQSVAQVLFPIGSIYTATVSTNPATLLGFGTWTAFGAGRTIIGNGGGYTAGNTGGSADAVVVSHTHTATSTVTDPTHRHNAYYLSTAAFAQFAGGGANSGNASNTTTEYASTGITVATSIASATGGVSGTNANLPPYVVVYMWQRTV